MQVTPYPLAADRRRIRFVFPDGTEDSIYVSTGDAVKFSEWANTPLGGKHIGEEVNNAGVRVDGELWVMFAVLLPGAA